MVNKLLRLEALAIFFLMLYFFHLLQGNWILFLLLLLTPDIFMVGYLKNKSLGATLYNIGHTHVLGLLLVAAGIILQKELIVEIGIILSAHVALDRSLGYGLKYPSGFKETHLGKLK